MKLSVNQKAELTVTVPNIFPFIFVKRIITQKSAWILKNIKLARERFESRADLQFDDYKKNKIQARKIIKAKLDHFAQIYDFSYNRIFIRNQKSRWGSCSAKKNLNFNYRLIFLEPDLLDYVLIHELCHLKEMNHSKKFWQLLAGIIPDYKERRKRLKKIIF